MSSALHPRDLHSFFSVLSRISVPLRMIFVTPDGDTPIERARSACVMFLSNMTRRIFSRFGIRFSFRYRRLADSNDRVEHARVVDVRDIVPLAQRVKLGDGVHGGIVYFLEAVHASSFPFGV